MANCAIVGINWGDEGKGRMVDLLTSDYDVVVPLPGRRQRRPHRGQRPGQVRPAPAALRHFPQGRGEHPGQRRGPGLREPVE